MSLFEPPPPPPEPTPVERWEPMAWEGPPENVLGGVVALDLLLAHSDRAAVAISSATAYRTGLAFTVELRLREGPPVISGRARPVHALLERRAPLGGFACGGSAAVPAPAAPDAAAACRRAGTPGALARLGARTRGRPATQADDRVGRDCGAWHRAARPRDDRPPLRPSALPLLRQVADHLREGATAGVEAAPHRLLRNWPLSVLPLVALARHREVGVHGPKRSCAGQTRRGLSCRASAARRFAADREQGGAALGAVALPAGTTVGQGHLPRVGDGDLLAADAPGLRAGVLCLSVPRAPLTHARQAYSRLECLSCGAGSPPAFWTRAGAPSLTSRAWPRSNPRSSRASGSSAAATRSSPPSAPASARTCSAPPSGRSPGSSGASCRAR